MRSPRAPKAAITTVAYRDPRRPGVPIEVISLSALMRKAPADFLARPQRPDFHQLVVVTRGRCRHEVDFRRLALRSGQALEVRPGQVQRFDLHAGLEGWLVLFTPELVRLPAALSLDATLGEPVIDLGRARADVAFLIGRLREASERDADEGFRTALLHHLLHTLLLVLYERRAPVARERSSAAGLERIFRLFAREVDRRFAKTRTLAEYATITGYSTKTLGRASSACAGQSAKAFVDQRVLLEARRLLAHTDLTAAQIGARLGFTDATNFIKFFERTGSEPPSAFRARATHVA